MHYQLTGLFIFGCYILHLTESVFIFNITTASKILCHSCKGESCEGASDNEENVIVCNKNTQLCWAGFIDQQPYRTCASRYCTPSGISLDSDIRIETCCHSNLCNNIPLSWSMWRKWYEKSSTRRPDVPPPVMYAATTRRTTVRRASAQQRVYYVNEIVDGEGRVSSGRYQEGDQEGVVLPRMKFNKSNPATFGINWMREPYDKNFDNPVVSISKLLILFMPILLVLLF